MGNKLGWILAGVLVVALIGIIVWQVGFPAHSPPRETLKEGMLDRKTIQVPVSAVVGFTPNGAGNAADDYAAAAKVAVEKDAILTEAKLAVDRAQEKKQPATVADEALAALEEIAAHVAKGARKEKMAYVFEYTPKSFKVDTRIPELKGLEETIASMEILGRYYLSHKQFDQAEKVLDDLFVMGRQMIDERSHIQMVEKGLGAQRAAWAWLFQLYSKDKPNPERLKALRDYEAEAIELGRFWQDKRRIVWALPPWPGDIFNCIENDKDPAWRLQAVLALGMIKFSATERGDHNYIKKLLSKLPNDKDPKIAEAAKAARDLRIEDYRMLGTSF